MLHRNFAGMWASTFTLVTGHKTLKFWSTSLRNISDLKFKKNFQNKIFSYFCSRITSWGSSKAALLWLCVLCEWPDSKSLTCRICGFCIKQRLHFFSGITLVRMVIDTSVEILLFLSFVWPPPDLLVLLQQIHVTLPSICQKVQLLGSVCVCVSCEGWVGVFLQTWM